MPGVFAQLPEGSRVAVIRLRSLGDCVLTTPALDLLKRSRPDLRIAVVVEDRFAAVFEGNSAVEVILPPSAFAIARWNPRLCLNLHGGIRSVWLTAASTAAYRAGFAHSRSWGAYNVRIPTAQEVLGVSRKVHTAEHLASAMFYLGAERAPVPRARLIAERLDHRRPYVVLHPRAATPEKTWPVANFLKLAEHLSADCRLEPVFIAGPGEDLRPFAAFRCHVGAPLPEIKSLLQSASLFVGNDSGPAHIAAAFGIPVVALFGPSDPGIWAPWRTESEVLRAAAGIDGIRVSEVVRAVEHLGVATRSLGGPALP